jgi:Cysteine desulfuration protein SufE
LVTLHAERQPIFFSGPTVIPLFVKGEIALLIKVLNGRTASEIQQAPLRFIDTIGLRQHLSMTRANGLASMIRQIRQYASA